MKILIVDDSKVIRKFIVKCLNDLGFTDLTEAADGQEALNIATTNFPDVVLLDWNMPVMNGLEFLLELRKLPDGNKPIVIFCTTENEISKVQLALNSSANEYIMKPFDSDILKTKFIQMGIING